VLHWDVLPNGRTVLLRVSGNRSAALRGIPGQWVYVSGEARSGHTETVPAVSSHIVNHNMGRRPSCVVFYTHGGVISEVGVTHLNVNQTVLNFDVPTPGTVEIC
jgi:hypothetical protein